MDELPDGLEQLSCEERLARLGPWIRRASARVVACEERWAVEDFEPEAAPTQMRDAVTRVLACIEPGAPEPGPSELEPLREELLDHLRVLVPDRDPGADDPWEALREPEYRAGWGLGVLAWALAALGGDLHDEEREWLDPQRGDPRLGEL